MNIKVSIYCLAYNHENYIKDTLEGFVNQKTNFAYEVFVHDDASTDNTAKIIKEYAEKYPDIIKPIYQTENQYSKGKNIPRDFIIENFSGEYVSVCEGDDYWTDPNKLQIQADFLDSHPDYSACIHNTLFYDFRTQQESSFVTLNEEADVDISQVISRSVFFHLSSIMYRVQYAKKAYSHNPPEFYHYAKGFGDYPLAIFLATEGKIRYINRTMSFYRYMTPGSWTSRNESSSTAIFNHYKLLRKFLIAVNKYTNYQYKKIIKKRIRDNDVFIIKRRLLESFPRISKLYKKLRPKN